MSLAKTQVKHYYTQRLRQKEFWIKLFSGKVAAGAVGSLMRGVKVAFWNAKPDHSTSDAQPFQGKMAWAWKSFDRPILLLLSGNDYTAKEFLEHINSSGSWSGALDQAFVQRYQLAGADHTCSSAASMELVESLTLEWLAKAVRRANDVQFKGNA